MCCMRIPNCPEASICLKLVALIVSTCVVTNVIRVGGISFDKSLLTA